VLVRSPDVPTISVTGSTATGKQIMAGRRNIMRDRGADRVIVVGHDNIYDSLGCEVALAAAS
jgi:acyl-CoA reductase-like NAD-dependent aldehyde dehydrogenase